MKTINLLHASPETRKTIKQQVVRLHKKGKTGVDIPERSISNYLDRWGMTCQRPTKKAYSQDNVKLKTFMEETYPAIAAKAKKENKAERALWPSSAR